MPSSALARSAFSVGKSLWQQKHLLFTPVRSNGSSDGDAGPDADLQLLCPLYNPPPPDLISDFH